MEYVIIRVDTVKGLKDQIMLDNGDETHTEILVEDTNPEYIAFLSKLKEEKN